MRILVIDRDDDRRDLTCVAVGVLGHRAEEAWDTRQALVALAAATFDVVIIDDQTPGFDAPEVTELLLIAARPSRPRPAIVVVADLDAANRGAFFRAGVIEVVPRPLSLAPLHGLLTRVDRAQPG